MLESQKQKQRGFTKGMKSEASCAQSKRRIANDNTRRGIETNENVQGQNVQDDLQ